MTEALTNFTHRRRVDDRHVLFGALDKQTEEKRLVMRMKAVEEHRLIDRTLDSREHFVHARDLLFGRSRHGRQESAKPKFGALLLREGDAVIAMRIHQNVCAAMFTAVCHFELNSFVAVKSHSV